MMQTVVVVVGRQLRSSVHHGVYFVEAVSTDEARHGAEMAFNAERVALVVEVRQRQHHSHQPRRRDHFHRPRLAREDFGVDRMNHGVEPAPVASMLHLLIRRFQTQTLGVASDKRYCEMKPGIGSELKL